ncbi:MAG: nucleotidyltransferase family protein [Armatimonadota bacterium]|nr:nucleotidyltransferase family protein [Armatimonadota bacterium]
MGSWRLLRGCWRGVPPRPEVLGAALAELLPRVQRTGLQGLAWRHLKEHPELSGEEAEALRQAHRFHALRNANRDRELVGAVGALRAVGVEPILIKGWAVGRLYPEPGLRPYGDIDLLVRADALAAAREALHAAGDVRFSVDLMDGGPWDRSVEELHRSSLLVPLLGIPIRVPCAEDHLRILCLHLLHHGAWKPIWLVDVAVALETRPPGFNWERFLAGDARHTEWALAVLRLAHEVLGAEVGGTPAEKGPPLPRWLVPAVLAAWTRGSGASAQAALGRGLALSPWRPRALVREVRAHWRGPIEATVELGAPLNNWPRFPLQLAATARRVPPLLGRMLRGA